MSLRKALIFLVGFGSLLGAQDVHPPSPRFSIPSRIAGAHVRRIGLQNRSVLHLASHATQGMLAATDQGLYARPAEGPWKKVSGDSLNKVLALTITPNQTVFASDSVKGLFRANPDLSLWENVLNESFEALPPIKFILARSDQEITAIATTFLPSAYFEAYRSVEGGNADSWKLQRRGTYGVIDARLTENGMTLVDPKKVELAGGKEEELIAGLEAPPQWEFLSMFPSGQGEFFAIFSGGLYRSGPNNESGATAHPANWTKIPTSQRPLHFIGNPMGRPLLAVEHHPNSWDQDLQLLGDPLGRWTTSSKMFTRIFSAARTPSGATWIGTDSGVYEVLPAELIEIDVRGPGRIHFEATREDGERIQFWKSSPDTRLIPGGFLIHLEAHPRPGASFVSWGQGVCEKMKTPTCNFLLDETKSVIAVFEEE
jgi:hypothetical protein